MLSFIPLIVVIIYFIFAHQKVLDHFGLSKRDDQLLWIGLLIPSTFTNFITFGIGAFAGNFLLTPLLFGLLGSYFIYSSYRNSQRL